MSLVRGIGGVAIFASAPSTLAAWYGSRLGIAMDFDELHTRYFGFVSDAAPRHRVAFSILGRGDPDWAGNSSAMITFRVRSLDAFAQVLHSRHLELRHRMRDANGQVGYLNDPEGNHLEIWEAPHGVP